MKTKVTAEKFLGMLNEATAETADANNRAWRVRNETRDALLALVEVRRSIVDARQATTTDAEERTFNRHRDAIDELMEAAEKFERAVHRSALKALKAYEADRNAAESDLFSRFTID